MRPTSCNECRTIAKANRKQPDCSACRSRAPELSEQNRQAWNLWTVLDVHGRDYDTMGGNPLPLRLEAVNAECGQYGDPQGLRWRVLLIDKLVIESRRKNIESKRGAKK